MLHECVRYCFYHPSLNQSYSVLNIVKTYLWFDFFILRPGRTQYTLPWDRCWQLCTNWSIPEHQQTGGSRCSLRGGAVSWGNYSRLPRLPRAGADTLWIGGSPLSPLVKGSYLKKQQQSNCYIARKAIKLLHSQQPADVHLLETLPINKRKRNMHDNSSFWQWPQSLWDRAFPLCKHSKECWSSPYTMQKQTHFKTKQFFFSGHET